MKIVCIILMLLANTVCIGLTQERRSDGYGFYYVDPHTGTKYEISLVALYAMQDAGMAGLGDDGGWFAGSLYAGGDFGPDLDNLISYLEGIGPDAPHDVNVVNQYMQGLLTSIASSYTISDRSTALYTISDPNQILNSGSFLTIYNQLRQELAPIIRPTPTLPPVNPIEGVDESARDKQKARAAEAAAQLEQARRISYWSAKFAPAVASTKMDDLRVKLHGFAQIILLSGGALAAIMFVAGKTEWVISVMAGGFVISGVAYVLGFIVKAFA